MNRDTRVLRPTNQKRLLSTINPSNTTLLSKVEKSWGKSASHQQPQSAIDRNGNEVQDTVENHLAGNGQSVGTLGQRPGDWESQPCNNEDTSEHSVFFGCANATSVLNTPDHHDICEDEVGEKTKGKVSPFVASSDESTAEPRNDPDLLESDGEEDGGPADTAEDEVGGDDEWPGERPVDVADVVDLTGLC